MAKPPVIENWEIGTMFGAIVVRGIVNGRRVCRRLLWWSHGRLGVTTREKGSTEEKYRPQ